MSLWKKLSYVHWSQCVGVEVCKVVVCGNHGAWVYGDCGVGGIAWCAGVTVCSCCGLGCSVYERGVWGLLCVGVAVCRSGDMWELRCIRVAVSGGDGVRGLRFKVWAENNLKKELSGKLLGFCLKRN